MTLTTQGDREYQASALLADAAEWDGMRVERRQIGAGVRNRLRSECTELGYVLSGQTKVRRCVHGQVEDGLMLPGTSWLVPAGTDETLLEFDGTAECLVILLPAKLLDDSALADHGIDPSALELVHASGFADPVLAQIAAALNGLMGRDPRPIDRVFADGLRMALGAHLIANYTLALWQPAARAPALEPNRLQRVLDFIKARLAEDISLDDLADEACLSPFHFSRLFREATGLSPLRYVVERRIQAAQAMLSSRHSSIAGIAFDTGFGSQAGFARTFRKATGLTPRQYRELHLR